MIKRELKMANEKTWTFEPEIPRKDEFMMVGVVMGCAQHAGFIAD